MGCWSACTPSGNKIDQEWKMYKIIQDGKDVTAEHDPYNERTINFTPDSFISEGRPFGRNTGTYTYSEEGILFLDSDAGEEDDSKWEVRFSGDTMFWQGVGTAWAERFEIIHLRVSK